MLSPCKSPDLRGEFFISFFMLVFKRSFGKGSVSLREMGEARREIAEVRKGRLREAIHRLSTAYPPDEGLCKKIVRKS